MNAFILKSRAIKVAKMLVELPRVISEAEALRQATVLAGWTQVQRDCWAARSNCSSPSETTWLLFIGAVLSRQPSSVSEVRLRRLA